jgi:hypothetical protein
MVYRRRNLEVRESTCLTIPASVISGIIEVMIIRVTPHYTCRIQRITGYRQYY